jgi:hypothetical protein
VRGKPARRFDLQPQLLLGAALGLVEEQLIGTDAQGYCELSEDLEGRLRGAALVAPGLGDVVSGGKGRCVNSTSSSPLRSGLRLSHERAVPAVGTPVDRKQRHASTHRPTELPTRLPTVGVGTGGFLGVLAGDAGRRF